MRRPAAPAVAEGRNRGPTSPRSNRLVPSGPVPRPAPRSARPMRRPDVPRLPTRGTSTPAEPRPRRRGSRLHPAERWRRRWADRRRRPARSPGPPRRASRPPATRSDGRPDVTPRARPARRPGRCRASPVSARVRSQRPAPPGRRPPPPRAPGGFPRAPDRHRSVPLEGLRPAARRGRADPVPVAGPALRCRRAGPAVPLRARCTTRTGRRRPRGSPG
jgi:hypothetical protein